MRLVGTHLDREIIDNARKTNRHLKFHRDFPDGVQFYQIEELEQALAGADLVIGGVSSFGVEWFGDYVLPRIAEGTPLLTVTKGLMDMPDGRLLTYPDLWQQKLDELGKHLPLCAPVPAMSWWRMIRLRWLSAAAIYRRWSWHAA